MSISLSNILENFDWIMGGLIAANVVLFGVLAFFPAIHNKLTNGIIKIIKKI
jgi:ATP/ADP translocase